MKRDLKEYYVTLQRQFKEVRDIAEKVNKEIEEGKLTQEQRDQFESYFMNVKTNYDRVSYIVYLIDLPPKFIQKIKERRLKKKYEESFKRFKEQRATAEDVIEENEKSIESAREELSSLMDSEDWDE